MILPLTYRLQPQEYNRDGPKPEEVRKVLEIAKGRSNLLHRDDKRRDPDFDLAAQPLLDEI